MGIKTIFPVTRVHTPLRVDVDIQGGKVVDAWVSGTLFRGFEQMMIGRDLRDAALFTQRICGICSCAHAIAANMAQQQIFKVQPTPNGQYLINLIYIADFIQNHLRHFYLLVLHDYCTGPDMPPYTPALKGDYRLPEKFNTELLVHARQGIELSARAHEMMALFGAKAPHQQTIMPTGVTERATAERIGSYGSILHEITQWVETVHISDVLTIAGYYKDYYNLGVGYGNMISYGMFIQPVTGKRAFQPGVIINRGTVEAVDSSAIAEHVRYSRYQEASGGLLAEKQTVPQFDKPEAYSWVKAPRYRNIPCECGPLARSWISGDYRRGISVMDRLVARAQEVLKLCRMAEVWLQQIIPGAPSSMPYTPISAGEGVALTDAMRGALGHWVSIEHDKVKHYQIITPTAWNFSPRDANGRRGPVEEALIGTPVANADQLIEVGRVVRSFDPCLTCAVHLLDTADNDMRIV